MRAALALLIVVAACGGDAPGVRLEILAGSTKTVRIELYLATRPCSGCDGGIAAKGSTGKLPGEVWFLDGGAMAGTPSTTATLDGGSYVYDLRSPDEMTDAKINHLVVVGYDANDTAVALGRIDDLAVLHDATTWYRLTLGPVVEQVSSSDPKPAGDRIWVWRRASNLAACVGLEQAGTAGVKRLWLVPEDDPDCDQVDLECDKYAYHANGTAQIADANCVIGTEKVTNVNTPSCLLGGPACVDGHGMDGSCGRVDPFVCLPDAVCGNPSCAPNLPVCVRDPQLVPRITCNVPFNMATPGQPCNVVAGRPSAVIDLGPLMVVPGTAMAKTSCKNIRFADLGLGRPSLSDQLTQGQTELTTGDVVAPCAFDLTWNAGPGTTLNNEAVSFVSLMDVELENANHMVLPIAIAFHPSTCTPSDVMKCIVGIAPTDGVTRCAQQ